MAGQILDFLPGGGISGVLLITTAVFVVFVTVLKMFQFMKKKQHMNRFLKDFDGPPGQLFVGNAGILTFDEKMLKTFCDNLVKYGSVAKYNIFGDIYMALGDPDALATIMKTTEPKDKVAYALMDKWIGGGILLSSGPRWFRNRRLLTPAFHFEVLKPYTEVFCRTSATLVSKWRDLCAGKEVSVEMFEPLSLMTLESMLLTAFSTESNCQKLGNQHPYISAVNQITKSVVVRLNSFPLRNDFIFYNLTQEGEKTKKALKVSQDFTKDIIRRKKKEKEESQGTIRRKYMDFVDMLLEARDSDGVGMTEKDILSEVDTFMFAGHDTTANALAWFMYNLAKHPEHQERCREEIDEVLEDRDIAWSDLPKLEYLGMCMKESLRLHGPVPTVSRMLTKDIKLPDGRTLPAGINVWLFMYLVHHNSNVWENPEEFDPQRFSSDNSHGRHSHAFVPFSAGPRNCIGQHFALNEMKVAAAQIIRNFHIGLDQDKLPERKLDVVLRSKDGIWLKLRPL